MKGKSVSKDGSDGEVKRNPKREGAVFVDRGRGIERETSEMSTRLKTRPATFGGPQEHRSPTPEEREKTPERPLSRTGTFGKKTPPHSRSGSPAGA